jgi:type IV pilus assembly protein PilC
MPTPWSSGCRVLKRYWWAVGGAIIGFWYIIGTTTAANGKLAIDKLMLKMPVLGDVLRKSAVSRFTAR